MNARSLPVLFLSLLLLAGFGRTASAQTTTTPTGPVLVYKLTFRALPDNISFRPYQGGYYVADIANTSGNSGTLILTQVVGKVRKYYTFVNFGQLFNALKSGDSKAIMSGTRTTTSPAYTNITFYGTGNAEKSEEYKLQNGELKLAIANELNGYALFVDSQEDMPFVMAPGQDIGTAGAMNVSLRYSQGHSEQSAKGSISRTAMVTTIQNQLKEQGYVSGG